MKRYPNINYEFRPINYWDVTDPLHSILRNVKGENRRQMILDYAAEGRLEELEAELLQNELDEKSRKSLGQIHPSFMGGEYLPGYSPGEIEIARICLKSTTSDVISLRARPSASGKIAYRVVDEYEETFLLPVPESKDPLTLEELICQLDNGSMENSCFPSGGLSLGYNNLNLESSGYENLRHFTRIYSDIYIQLYEHYERVFTEWLENGLTEQDSVE